MVNMMKLMKQAAAMQKNMEKLQGELSDRTFEFSSGGGMVKATVKGDFTPVSIIIDPKVVDPSDVDMLQDLVLAAVDGAVRTARETTSSEMGKLTSGLGISLPGM